MYVCIYIYIYMYSSQVVICVPGMLTFLYQFTSILNEVLLFILFMFSVNDILFFLEISFEYKRSIYSTC